LGRATTRSAAHALWMMGLEIIYLVNRDVGEVEAVNRLLSHPDKYLIFYLFWMMDSPHGTPTYTHLVHLTHPDQVESLLVPRRNDNTKPCILMIVGAIPHLRHYAGREDGIYNRFFYSYHSIRSECRCRCGEMENCRCRSSGFFWRCHTSRDHTHGA